MNIIMLIKSGVRVALKVLSQKRVKYEFQPSGYTVK